MEARNQTTSAGLTPTSMGAIIYKNMILDYISGTLSLLEFIIGASLNFLSILYFFSKKKQSSVTIQYIFISATDFFLCFSCLFIAIETLILAVNSDSDFLHKSTVICNIGGVIWNILPRFSIYLIAVLNVSRCITLWNPFKPAKKLGILISILGYLVILVLQSCIPYMYGTIYYYDDRLYSCSWRFDDEKFGFSETTQTVLIILMLYAEYCAPALPILVSVVLTVWCLLRKPRPGMGVLDEEKREATLTVIILTIIYIMFNFFLWIYLTADLMYYFTGWDYSIALNLREFHNKLISNMYFHHSVALNSVFNAIVYFVRRKNLQKYLRDLSRKYIFDVFIRKTDVDKVQKLNGQATIRKTSYMTLHTTVPEGARRSTVSSRASCTRAQSAGSTPTPVVSISPPPVCFRTSTV